MTTLFPGALDAFSNPSGDQSQAASRTHSQMHGDAFDAIEALQAALGTTGSTGTPLSLRGELADGATAGKGAALVKVSQAGAGAVARTARDKFRDMPTVEDYGAVGDGVTNDAAAFTAMAVATGGVIVALAKEYNVGALSLSGYTRLVIRGAGKPKPDLVTNPTKLVGGTVLVGRLLITGNNVEISNLGADCGPGRAAVVGAITDGIVIDAVSGQRGNRAIAHNVAVMGASSANATHALLVEGYDFNDIKNIYVDSHRYGVVVKGRNAQVRHIDGKDLDTACVYIKGDLSANAGGVLDGSVHDVQVHDVQCRFASSNSTGSAVYLHASTDSVAGVQVNSVRQTYGHSALRVQGPGNSGDPNISGVVASNIASDKAQQGVYAAGYCYDVVIDNIKAVNPATGKAAVIAAQVAAWKLDGVHVLISDTVNITSTNCGDLDGNGIWDNWVVRNPARTMLINSPVSGHASVIAGKKYGPVLVNGEATLAMANGAAAQAAPDAPSVKVLPGSVIQMTGRINVSAMTNAANTDMASMGIVTTRARYFSCVAYDGTNYSTVAVKVNSFLVTLMPARGTLQWVDLSNINFQF